MRAPLVHQVDKPLDGSPNDMSAAVDRAMALLYLMHAKTCELEQSKAELRALAGLDLPLPTLRANGKRSSKFARLTDHDESTFRSSADETRLRQASTTISTSDPDCPGPGSRSEEPSA